MQHCVSPRVRSAALLVAAVMSVLLLATCGTVNASDAALLTTDSPQTTTSAPCYINNCAECDAADPSMCKRCKDGYEQWDTFRCVLPKPCPGQFCKRCYPWMPEKCFECEEGYTQNANQECEPISNRVSMSIGQPAPPCKLSGCAVCNSDNPYYCKRCAAGHKLMMTNICRSSVNDASLYPEN